MIDIKKIGYLFIISMIVSCNPQKEENEVKEVEKKMTAKEILGNPKYRAISYGGYRQKTRDAQPTIDQLKEDMLIMHAMGIRLLRTYNVQLAHAGNVLKAISQIKQENSDFEMYVMLGAWIDCKNAWTDLEPDHNIESEQNEAEIQRAAALANQYPDIVKIIAVGNEAMVKWATSYFVQPGVILKWVEHLQNMKKKKQLPEELWITSSDDFASWGGGDAEYHVADLEKLMKAVDFISMHTYPMHNTHYNPAFWGVLSSEDSLSTEDQILKAMERSRDFAINQYGNVTAYMKSLGINKPIHIGETGWSTFSNGHYGPNGSKATDEYKQGLYHKLMREWTDAEGISCFFFEAFDEPWKDSHNPKGSENHFGLFTVDGRAKYGIWELVDEGVFVGLKRGGMPIKKTYDGNADALMVDVTMPPVKQELDLVP